VTAYVFIDVSRKQEYIFRHNQLRLNLYHSAVIKLLTEAVPDFPHTKYKHLTLSKFLENEFSGQYEFVYSGGGNSIIRWDDGKLAKAFIARYTTQVLTEYPELEMYISLVHDSEIRTDGNTSPNVTIWKKLIELSDRLKDRRRARFQRWSYGIEQIGETGLPVVDEHYVGTNDLQGQIKLVKGYLKDRFTKILGDASLLQYTDELQNYRQDDEGNSYIGVIAIDGNRMGEMFSQLTSFEARSRFSSAIEELYGEAIVKGLNRTAEQLKLKSLLFTPVIMSGDDACVIVPASAAVQAAANIVRMIHELSRNSRVWALFSDRPEAHDPQLHACAGVAIARYSYPFFELVRRAEAKCRDAKEAIHRLSDGDDESANASFLDWVIVQGQTESSEEPKYNRYGEKLQLRPLRLDGDPPAVQDGIYSYRAFMDLALRLKQAIESEEADKKISQSLLTDLKRMVHAGWDVYRTYLEMKRTSDVMRLTDLVKDIYGPNEMATIKEYPSDKPETRTYLLSDVLQILRFIQPVREDKTNAIAH